MLILLNKNKIYSCMITICLALILFAISSFYTPNQDVQVMHVSSNIIENTVKNELNNNLNMGNNN